MRKLKKDDPILDTMKDIVESNKNSNDKYGKILLDKIRPIYLLATDSQNIMTEEALIAALNTIKRDIDAIFTLADKVKAGSDSNIINSIHSLYDNFDRLSLNVELESEFNKKVDVIEKVMITTTLMTSVFFDSLSKAEIKNLDAVKDYLQDTVTNESINHLFRGGDFDEILNTYTKLLKNLQITEEQTVMRDNLLNDLENMQEEVNAIKPPKKRVRDKGVSTYKLLTQKLSGQSDSVSFEPAPKKRKLERTSSTLDMYGSFENREGRFRRIMQLLIEEKKNTPAIPVDSSKKEKRLHAGKLKSFENLEDNIDKNILLIKHCKGQGNLKEILNAREKTDVTILQGVDDVVKILKDLGKTDKNDLLYLLDAVQTDFPISKKRERSQSSGSNLFAEAVEMVTKRRKRSDSGDLSTGSQNEDDYKPKS